VSVVAAVVGTAVAVAVVSVAVAVAVAAAHFSRSPLG